MESSFYRDLVEMADKAKQALDVIETRPTGPTLPTNALHALARACIDGDKLEASISKDLGAKRKHDFEKAVFFLNSNRSYTNARGQNPNVDAAIHNIKQLSLALADEAMKREKDASNAQSIPSGIPFDYVSKTRISDLHALHSLQQPGASLDVTRLIRLLEELNDVSGANCHMSTAMVVRAILDHVPPVFGMSNFQQVANNYAGQQSFKKSMRHLQESLRNIADAHLHCLMRKSEVLPTENQVDFRNDLDVLLGEIVRLLKNVEMK